MVVFFLSLMSLNPKCFEITKITKRVTYLSFSHEFNLTSFEVPSFICRILLRLYVFSWNNV